MQSENHYLDLATSRILTCIQYNISNSTNSQWGVLTLVAYHYVGTVCRGTQNTKEIVTHVSVLAL